MTTREKAYIHEHLSAYRIGPAIAAISTHLSEEQSELRQRLAKLEGRHEHFKQTTHGNYTPVERRQENDDLVKALQLILSKVTINDRPKTLADILGRDLDEEFIERDKPTEAAPAAHANDSRGFTGDIVYEGSPSAKRTTIVTEKSYGATYHLCIQTLRGQNVDLEKGDREGGTIRGNTAGNSQARFGEIALLYLTPQPKGKTRVVIIVDSNLKDTVFDMGRHQKLLDALAHKIKYG